MKTKKYKILLLSDFKKSTKNTFKSTVSLAKMIDADIDFFYVKKPTEIITKDNQLSAMRSINKEHVSTDKKIKDLIESYSEGLDLKIKSSFAFGNVKNEIDRYIKQSKPDIIVLGKRKAKSLRLIGDNITDHVLKTHKGAILITSDKKALEPNKELSLGLLNDSLGAFNMDFADALLEHAKTPFKAFKIVKNPNNSEKKEESIDGKAVEFVFEQNDNSIKNLFNYLLKSDVDLAYIDRANLDIKSKDNSISDIIERLEVPVLLSNEQEVA